jgi:hypothetical protein
MWDSLLHHVRDDAKADAQALVAQAKDQVASVVRAGTAAVATDAATVESDAAQLAGDAASTNPDVSVTTATGAAAAGQHVGTVAGTSAPTDEQLANAGVSPAPGDVTVGETGPETVSPATQTEVGAAPVAQSDASSTEGEAPTETAADAPPTA